MVSQKQHDMVWLVFSWLFPWFLCFELPSLFEIKA